MDRFVRNPDTLFSELGDDIVALSVARGECYGMSDVSADIWKMLAVPVSAVDICSALQESYDVEEQRCRDDVDALLKNMVEKGLITPA